MSKTDLVSTTEVSTGVELPGLDPSVAELRKVFKLDELYRRLTQGHVTRNCIGLGATFSASDIPVAFSNRLIYRADQVLFQAIRDVPAGCMTGMDHRSVYVSSARSTILNGAPVLKFDAADTAVMLSHPPGGYVNDKKRPEEFSLFSALNRDMTEYAFWSVDDRGRPILPVWHHARQMAAKMKKGDLKTTGIKPSMLEELSRGSTRMYRYPCELPMPFLSFKPASSGFGFGAFLSTTFQQVSEAEVAVESLECPRCHILHDLNVFGLHDDTGVTLVTPERQLQLEFTDDRDIFIAFAPCGCRGSLADGRTVWHMSDARPRQFVRHFNDGFKAGFCRAVSRGLRFYAPARCSYAGCKQIRLNINGLMSDSHRFDTDSGFFDIHVRPNLPMRLQPGDTLKPGDLLLQWLQQPASYLEWWGRQPLQNCWNNLLEIFQDSRWLEVMQMEWFANQAILLDDQVLLPFHIISRAASKLKPVGLSWDFGRLVGRMNHARTLCRLDPIGINRWNDLRHEMMYGVELDARIDDPRIKPDNKRPRRRNGARR